MTSSVSRRLAHLCSDLRNSLEPAETVAARPRAEPFSSSAGASVPSLYPVNRPSPDRLVYMSGELVPETEAKLSIFDSAVTLGDQITDSSRTFAHTPFKLEQHIRRLYDSALAARIDIGFSPERMMEITLDLLVRNLRYYGPEQDCWIVHNVSRGGGPDAPQTTEAGRALNGGSATVMIMNNFMDLTTWSKFYRPVRCAHSLAQLAAALS